MKVKIIQLDKNTAKELLSKNKKNRQQKRDVVNFYKHQMVNGEWQENGEPIIVDINGHLKDGQHRCVAVLESGYSYKVPLIYNVQPDVMKTIDTGRNRSLSDVLQLNGIKNSVPVAGMATAALLLESGRGYQNAGNSKMKISNNIGLDYVLKHNDYLQNSVSTLKKIYNRQTVKIFPLRTLFYIQHMIAPYDVNEQLLSFLNELSGVSSQEGTGVNYVYRLTAKSTQNKTPLNKTFILALIVKAWNLYIQGNPPVKYLKHDLKHDFPKVNTI